MAPAAARQESPAACVVADAARTVVVSIATTKGCLTASGGAYGSNGMAVAETRCGPPPW
jgi:phage baseplate assembly protein gpV